MSRTFKREPIRRNRSWWDDFNESDHIKHVASKAPKLEFDIDNMLSFHNDNSGDNTFTRDANGA